MLSWDYIDKDYKYPKKESKFIIESTRNKIWSY